MCVVCQWGRAQPLKTWNLIRHCHPHFLFSISFPTMLAFYHSNQWKASFTKRCHQKARREVSWWNCKLSWASQQSAWSPTDVEGSLKHRTSHRALWVPWGPPDTLAQQVWTLLLLTSSTALELQEPCFFPCVGRALTLSTRLASVLFSLPWMLFLPQVLSRQMPSQSSGLSSNIAEQPKDSLGHLLNCSLLFMWASFLGFVALTTVWAYAVYLFNGSLTYFLASPSAHELCEGFTHYCFPRTMLNNKQKNSEC